MSTWSSCCIPNVILGWLTYPHKLSLRTHTHTACSSSLPLCLASPAKTPLSVFAWGCDQCWARAAHVASSPDTNQTLMKTFEALPRPLASAHTVPNHTLLWTLKRTPLIGAIVENLYSLNWRGPEMSRCGVLLFQYIAHRPFPLNCYSDVCFSFVLVVANDFLWFPGSPKYWFVTKYTHQKVIISLTRDRPALSNALEGNLHVQTYGSIFERTFHRNSFP